jgi:hypothetical protein
MISFVAVDCVAFIAFLVEAAVFLDTVGFGAFTAFFCRSSCLLSHCFIFLQCHLILYLLK